MENFGTLKMFRAEDGEPLSLPLAETVSAGFPSPAEDYMEQSIDLNRELIHRPSSTFFARVRGDSMKDAGIVEGDILIIDRSLRPVSGRRCVCHLDGEFVLKTVRITRDEVWLDPANPAYAPFKVPSESLFLIWGVVTYVIHKV